MQITINEDSTFFVCDESGDVNPGADLGLYYQDTRFLSLYQLRVAGTVPEHLTSYSVTYFHALHVLTNCALESIREGSMGIVRSQTVGNGFHEDIDITNYAETPVRIPIDIYLSADYEDILGIRGQIVTGEKREAQHKGRYWASPSEDNLSLTFHFSEDGYNPSTSIRFSRPLKISTEGEKVSAEANLEPRETWHL